MEQKESRDLSRRSFLGFISSLSFFCISDPALILADSIKGKNTGNRVSKKFISVKLEYFSAYQASIIDDVANMLIPSDDSPGAREIGIVFEMDKFVSKSNRTKKLFRNGIEWLDYMSDKLFDGDSFLNLTTEQKAEILKIADPVGASFITKVYLFLRYRNIREAIRFFRFLKSKTFEMFYSSEAGWSFVDYDGPPQWSGNRDYNKCSL